MKHLIFIFLLLALATVAFAATATWTGATSVNWDTYSNWSTNAVPTSSTDVIIPNTARKPHVIWANAICNTVTIQPTATLVVDSADGHKLTVGASMTVNGTLSISNSGLVSIGTELKCYGTISALGTGNLTVFGNAYWYSGSSIVDNGLTMFILYRELYIYDGAGFIMDSGGFVQFVGNVNSNIRNYSAATQFGRLISHKTPGEYLNIHLDSTQPFIVNNALINDVNSKFFCSKNITITVYGNITDNNSADAAGTYGFKFTNGTVKMDGDYQYIDMQGPGSILKNLICSATEGVFTENDLTINGNLSIQEGVFYSGNRTIKIGGNWDNQVGPGGFQEGTGRVIFKNTEYHQTILSNETFNILEVNNAPYALRFTSGKTVTCAKYDWSSGGIDVNTNATFTALDLIDAGIYGSWRLSNADGTINLTNDNVDLKGSINISAGTFNIDGTNHISHWSSYVNATLNMSGGILDFKNSEINIFNNPSAPNPILLTLNIIGGTIRTDGGFNCTWAGWAPTGGTFEFNAPDSHVYVLGTYVRFHHLKVSAGWVEFSCNSDVTLGGNLDVRGGYLDTRGHVISCVNVDIYSNISISTLKASDYIYWWSGSVLSNSPNCCIECGGNWMFGSGSDVQLGLNDYLYFTGTGALWIYNYSATNSFGQWKIGEDSSGATYTGGVYKVNANSTQDLNVPSFLSIRAGNSLNLQQRSMNITHELNLWGTLIIGSGTATVNGLMNMTGVGKIAIDTGTLYLPNQTFLIPAGAEVTMASGTIKCDGITANGTFQPAGGTVILSSTGWGYKVISLAAGNWFPNLTIDSPERSYYLGSDITIKRDFTLDWGTFGVRNPLTTTVYNMYVAENWWNNQGPSNFEESTGKVVFNGPGFQAIKTTEIFYIVEVNKTGSANALRLESGYPGVTPTVTIAKYDWTAGALDVQAGTISINDLMDNGMYGGFYCTPAGILNITQDATQTINLFGTIQLTGGIMNIYGGNGDAYWAGYSPSTVNISSGELHYHSQGLQIRQTHPLTYTISGGTVSTTGSLYCNRTDFIPAGGSFEMRGNADSTLDFQSAVGSSLFNLTINKTNLGNTVTQAANSQTIRGHLIIDNGSYYMINRTLNCLGDLTINDAAKLNCDSSCTVKMAAGKTINVNNGGAIEANGVANNTRVNFTHFSDGYYNFNVHNGGTFLANFVIFEYTGVNGVYIQPGASTTGPHDSIFRNGIAGGVLLRMDSGETLVITNANFPTNAGGGAKNVAKTVNSGSVYFSNWSGAFGGPAYEQDSYNRINWQGTGAPQITDLVITYIPATNNVKLEWSYPQTATSYKIYRSTDPYGTFTWTANTSLTTWTEVVQGPKYFYKVTAVTP